MLLIIMLSLSFKTKLFNTISYIFLLNKKILFLPIIHKTFKLDLFILFNVKNINELNMM